LNTLPPSPLRAFIASESAGGLVLIAAAAAALIVANSIAAPVYLAALHLQIGPLSVLHWINDGLMALFFLLVGLEIKRELIGGHLSRWSDRALPMIAAAGGMAVPAVVYVAVTRNMPGLARGWAIPSATDIAFAIGVLSLLGRRVPASLKLFLTSVAIADDMGAVLIIALAYTASVSLLALLAAGAILAVMIVLNRVGVRVLWPYLALAAGLWVAIHASGIHATIAGVLAALAMPITSDPARSPLHRLEHRLHPWVAFGVVPLFGFANAGVSLAGAGPENLLAPLPLGVAAGLFIGKQAGVFGGVWLAVRLRLATRPAGAGWAQVYGVALLCGIGFTMSLFIGGLAFHDPLRGDAVKIGVLAGSILSALVGLCVLRGAHGGGRPRVVT
jgi:NhaA family Na+:H+ antiporter